MNEVDINVKSFSNMMRPLRLYFYLNFMVTTLKTPMQRIADRILLIFYNVTWLLNVLTVLLCLNVSDINYLPLSLLSKLLAFLSWWIVYKRKTALRNCLLQILSLQSNRPRKWCCDHLGLKISILLLVLTIFIPFIYVVVIAVGLTTSSPQENRSRNRCSVSLGTMPLPVRIFLFVMWQILGQHIDWSIHFAVAVTYSVCCRELSRSAKELCSNTRRQLHPWDWYRGVRHCLRQIEAQFSVLVFIFLCRSFLEFFRVLTILLNRSKVNLDVPITVAAALHSAVILGVVTSVVSSAAKLLADYKRLCDVMTAMPRAAYGGKGTSDFEAFREFMRLLDDKENLTLTGWGMFHLKKNFFVTAAATLVSYGVILHQFHS